MKRLPADYERAPLPDNESVDITSYISDESLLGGLDRMINQSEWLQRDIHRYYNAAVNRGLLEDYKQGNCVED